MSAREGGVGDAVVIVRGRHTNEPGIVVGSYTNGRRRTLDVLLGRTGERVRVLRSSVDFYAAAR